MKYLGGNFWLHESGMWFNTTLQCLINPENLPAAMKFKESVGNYEVIRERVNFPKNNGTKFVTFDMCLEFSRSKSGKSWYAEMINVKILKSGWDFQKSKNVNNDFILHKPYILFLKTNHDCVDGYELLHYKLVI